MRILLIESGGFVGVPLKYEVDVSRLRETDFTALERVVSTEMHARRTAPTSAGESCVRLERDDGSISEATFSHASPGSEALEILERLRRHAKLVRD